MASRLCYMVRCPKHDDRNPSAVVYDDGHLHCFVCGHHDNAYAGFMVMPPPQPKARYEGPLPWSMVKAYQRLLWGPFRHRLGWLTGRGLRRLTIEKLHLGHTGRHFTIPIWDQRGLVTIKYRRDDRLDPSGPKYRSLPGSRAEIYGAWQGWSNSTVVVCEGELDAARLIQELWLHNIVGVTAIALTNGANGLKDSLVHHIYTWGARRIVLAYDQDEPGNVAALKASKEYACYGPNRIAWWPTKWGKDVTEAINTVGFEKWWQTAIKPHLDQS